MEVVSFYKKLPVRDLENQSNLFCPESEDIKDDFYEAALFQTSQKVEPGLSFREMSYRDEADCYVNLMATLEKLHSQPDQ